MVNRIVQGIELGRIKLQKPKRKSSDEDVFDLWGGINNSIDQLLQSKLPPAINAPKLKLPTHAESYNPPQEFLFNKKELKEWNELDPEDRDLNFIPKKFDCLRHVQFYDKLINERFDRCLDLYLCPRARKRKLDIDPESLIPTLP